MVGHVEQVGGDGGGEGVAPVCVAVLRSTLHQLNDIQGKGVKVIEGE